MTKQSLMPIDPYNITDFDRNSNDKELFLIFCIAVAGRSSVPIAAKVNRMFDITKDCMPDKLPDNSTETMKWSAALMRTYLNEGMSPFGCIGALCDEKCLGSFLELHSLGQYSRISKALRQLTRTRGGLHVIDRVTVDELIKYDGIGPKTARFFILHSFPNQKLAVLDTHILRHISEYVELSLQHRVGKFNVPRTTPQAENEYKFWEIFWLGLCKANGKDPALYDLEVWKNKGGDAYAA